MQRRQKKIVFQINRYSIRNHMVFSNFIILACLIICFLIGLSYAFLATPQFMAVGVLENNPYSPVNDIATNPINQVQKLQFNIIPEMDLIQTPNVLVKTVKQLHLDAEITHKTHTYIGQVLKIISDNLKFSQFTKGRLKYWFDHNGSPITFKQFVIPNHLIAESFTLTYADADKFSLKLPSGQKIQGQFNKPIVFDSGRGVITVDAIYAKPNQQFIIVPKSPTAIAALLKKNLTINIPNYESKQGDARLLVNQNLIEVSYIARNPVTAAAIVNSVLEQAVLASQARKRLESRHAVKLLKLQQNILIETLDKQNTTLAELKNHKQNPLDIENQTRYLLAQLGNIQDDIRRVTQDKVSLEQTATAVNPDLIALNRQIRLLKQDKAALTKKINAIPATVSAMNNLQTKILANTEYLEKITYQIQQLSAMEQSAFGDLRIAQKSLVPVVNISYSRWILVLLAIGIGLIVGYVLSLALS
jgi:tyrosine-protein kinase Etk/Wzc